MAKTNGKHGNFSYHIKELHDKHGNALTLIDPVFVLVHDNSDNGLDDETRKKIAERACTNAIYWSDDRLCYWMFDFKVWDHWCEMVDVPDEPYYECLHINAYC